LALKVYQIDHFNKKVVTKFLGVVYISRAFCISGTK